MASHDLYDAVNEFFRVCLAALEDTRGGAPECAYIAEGPPTWDACPCLVVYAGGPAVGDTFPLQPSLAPLHREATAGKVNLVAITAISLRCVPVLGEDGTLPQPAEHAAAAAEILDDMWALWNHVGAAKRHGTLFAPREREFGLDPAVPLNPQGEAGGCQITVRTELGGYDPFADSSS